MSALLGMIAVEAQQNAYHMLTMVNSQARFMGWMEGCRFYILDGDMWSIDPMGTVYRSEGEESITIQRRVMQLNSDQFEIGYTICVLNDQGEPVGETIINVEGHQNALGDAPIMITFPKDPVGMDSQQLAEFGHLLLALSNGDYEKDAVQELLEGYEIGLDSYADSLED